MIQRLINTYSFHEFPKILRKLREQKKLTRKQFGLAIGKEDYQVQRYEALKGQKALPSIETFMRMCLILQIDPSELLGLEWVNAEQAPEPGIIYKWTIGKPSDLITKFMKFHWQCSNHFCQHHNIEYNAYKLNKFVKSQFMCESCNTLFYKIHGVENDKKKKRNK